MVYSTSGWTLSIAFRFTGIADDTAVHAVCVGIPEASSHSAFSEGFPFISCIFFIILAVQHSCCSARRQHSPLLRPAGPATRSGAARHGATSLRDQVNMRHFPYVSDGSNFSRTRLVFLRFIVHAYQHPRWSSRSSLIFSSCYKQANLERMHFASSSIEDFSSSRRRIDKLSVWPMFQLFHSTFLESDRAARGRSLLIKKKNGKGEEREKSVSQLQNFV